VKDPFGETIYFRERTLQSATPAALLAKYLELSDAKVYGPYTRALLGTASHFCEVAVLKLL